MAIKNLTSENHVPPKRKKRGKQTTIGILGLGNMGEALLKGILRGHLISPEQIMVSDSSSKRLRYIHKEYKVATTPSNEALVRSSSLVFLVIKPQVVSSVLSEIRQAVTQSHLLVSVVAGLTISSITAGLGGRRKVIRVMSNAPALIGEGATALAPGEGIEEKELKNVEHIFDALGRVVIVQEKDMDVITGLSGSGPAYLFMVMEALADGAVRMGLSREVALFLAAQTTLGAARMVLETGLHPAVLKEKVTSPGGTTMAGIHQLESDGLRGTLMSAVKAATERSAELGKLGRK